MSSFKENTLCLICSQNIADLGSHKITDCLDPDLTIYQFLQTVSNFNKLDISEVPQNACEPCQTNILQIYSFHMLCNKSVEHLHKIKEKSIKESNKEDDEIIIFNFCDDGTPCEDVNLFSEEESDHFNEDSMGLDGDKLSKSEDEVYSPSNSVKKTKKRKAHHRQPGERIECPECNKFYRRDYMKIHQRKHTGERPYKCKLCPKDFVTVASLIDHRRVHFDERPHLCTVCGARFRKKTALDSHFRQHSGVRPYICEICGKSFTTQTRKKEHITLHSDAKPFACLQCPKRFRLNKLLKQHMVTHAKIKPIECTFCGKRFTQRHVLRTHQAKSCQGPGNNVNVDLVPK